MLPSHVLFYFPPLTFFLLSYISFYIYGVFFSFLPYFLHFLFSTFLFIFYDFSRIFSPNFFYLNVLCSSI
jgi:hypothetical protein